MTLDTTWGDMICEQLITIQLDSSSSAISFSPSCLRLVKTCYILGCLEGVWELSGGCMSDSGYCLVGYDLQETKKHPVRLIFIRLFLFSQLPRIGHNVPYFGVSVGCLGGA